MGRVVGSIDGRAVERRSLAALYERHADDAVGLAYLLTGDRALAEDLMQEAFVRIAARFRHIRDPAAFGTYLRRTVINLANSHFRRRVDLSGTPRLRANMRILLWPSLISITPFSLR